MSRAVRNYFQSLGGTKLEKNIQVENVQATRKEPSRSASAGTIGEVEPRVEAEANGLLPCPISNVSPFSPNPCHRLGPYSCAFVLEPLLVLIR
jgi:hypothetical protein